MRSTDHSTRTLEFNRDDMVQSTLSAIASLKDYQQRRLSLEARAMEDGEVCPKIEVRSVVIEQGLMNNQPYRFEATEVYLLELRQGEWLATQAETTQR